MAKIANQKLETVALDRLRPHPANPRRGDVNAVRESIEANGFYGAVVAQRSTGHILAGNHRFYALKEAGVDEVPVFWLDVDDERAMRILLADNRTSDLAEYDDAALAQLLGHLASTDAGLVGTGYDEAALSELLEGLGGVGAAPGSAPPDDFEEYDEEIKIEYCCPKCGYEWSGKPR